MSQNATRTRAACDASVAEERRPFVGVPVHKIDFLEVMVELGGIEHNLSIYLKAIAKRADGDSHPFYSNIVAEQLASIGRIRAEMERALKAHNEGRP